MGYLKRQGNIPQQTDPELDKTHAGSMFPASPQMESSPQEFHLSPSAAEEIPAGDVQPSSHMAESKDQPLYTTRSGRLVKKPVRLDL